MDMRLSKQLTQFSGDIGVFVTITTATAGTVCAAPDIVIPPPPVWLLSGKEYSRLTTEHG